MKSISTLGLEMLANVPEVKFKQHRPQCLECKQLTNNTETHSSYTWLIKSSNKLFNK